MTLEDRKTINFIRLTTNDFGLTVSGLIGAGLSAFSDGVLSTSIAALVVLNLLAGLALAVQKLRRKGNHWP